MKRKTGAQHPDSPCGDPGGFCFFSFCKTGGKKNILADHCIRNDSLLIQFF